MVVAIRDRIQLNKPLCKDVNTQLSKRNSPTFVLEGCGFDSYTWNWNIGGQMRCSLLKRWQNGSSFTSDPMVTSHLYLFRFFCLIPQVMHCKWLSGQHAEVPTAVPCPALQLEDTGALQGSGVETQWIWDLPAPRIHISEEIRSKLSASKTKSLLIFKFDFFFFFKRMEQNLERIICLLDCISYLGQHGCCFWIWLNINRLVPSFLSLRSKEGGGSAWRPLPLLVE